MFRARTCFVIGAGASAEAGFPAGGKLLQTIAEKLALRYEMGTRFVGGDGVINQALLKKAGGHINDAYRTLFDAARRISDAAGMGLSIDNIIEQHDDDENVQFCGKVAIVRAILESERASRLMPVRGQFDPDISKIDDTWYHKLAQMLSEGVPRRKIGEIFNNVSFVTFNYDRSLEYYLPRALSKIYGIDDAQISEAMKKMQIVHPYGTVGKLPAMRREEGVNFGSDENDIVELAPNIRTFSERIDDQDELTSIRNPVEMAEHIVFLGFAYHRQNMDLLVSDTSSSRRLFGTVMGIAANDQLFIRQQLASMFAVEAFASVTLQDSNCVALMSDNWRSMTGDA